MDILFYTPDTHLQQPWLADLRAALPQATIRLWQAGDNAPADYAIIWKPEPGILGQRPGLKAIFNLGAGVDAILKLPDLPAGIPLIRNDGGGMDIQMAEYVTYAVLRHYRRFDTYEAQQRNGAWEKHPSEDKSQYRVGLLGIGVLGQRIAASLQHLGFNVSAWSRSPKQLPGMTCHAGESALPAFLASSNILACALPLTPETVDILDRDTLQQLPKGAYVINIARGEHIVDNDLLALVQSGHLSGATLDAFREEPLPAHHPFWQEPRIRITPHISALTMRTKSAQQIAAKIIAFEQGQPVSGVVNPQRGY